MLVLILIQYTTNYNLVDAELLVEARDDLEAQQGRHNNKDTSTSATDNSLFGIILLSSDFQRSLNE